MLSVRNGDATLSRSARPRLDDYSEIELTRALSRQYGVPSINLNEFEIESAVVSLLSRDLVVRNRVMPVNIAGASVIVALSDPSNTAAIEEVREATSRNVEVVISTDRAISDAISKYYGEGPHTPT